MYKHLQELAATAAELHYHTHSPRDSDISATFFFIFSHSEQFFLFFVCGTLVVGYYHDRRVDYRSSRVTLLWLWLPSIIEGVWGIHFLLRLSPCVHSTSLTYLFWRERELTEKRIYFFQRHVVWNGEKEKEVTNQPISCFVFFFFFLLAGGLEGK